MKKIKMGHLLSLGAACVFMASLMGCIGITSSGNDGGATLASKTTGDGAVNPGEVKSGHEEQKATENDSEKTSTKEADNDSGKTEGKVCDKKDHEEVEGAEGKDSSEVEPPETDEVKTPEPKEAPETEAKTGDDKGAVEAPETTGGPEVADATAGTP